MPATSLFLAFEHVSCYKCGVVFGIESSHNAVLRETHRDFYCPNGHAQHWLAETDAERLAKELRAQRDQTAREKHWREQAETRARNIRLEKEHVERRLRGTKSVVTRMKRRAIAGRCPCCSHEFKDLKRHMKTQHPRFDPDRAAEALSEK